MVGGVVQNLTVENATIKGTFCAGVIVGHTYGKVLNCKVENATVECNLASTLDGKYKDGNNAGAIAGFIESNGDAKADIDNCEVVNVKVSAYRCVGSIAGTATIGAIISNCKIENVTLEYIALPEGAEEEEGKENSYKDVFVGRLINNAQLINNIERVVVTTAEELLAVKGTGNQAVISEDAVIELTDTEYVSSVKGLPAIVNRGTLTIKGGTYANENIEAQGAAAIVNYGTLTIDGGTFGSELNRGAAVQNNGGTITINGGTFNTMDRSHSSNGFAYVFINRSGTMIINDATSIGDPNGMFYAYSGTTIIVNGGTYSMGGTGKNTWHMAYAEDGAEIQLNGGNFYWGEGAWAKDWTVGNVVLADGVTYKDPSEMPGTEPEEPTHTCVTCEVCGLCTAEDCTVVDGKCAGHEEQPVEVTYEVAFAAVSEEFLADFAASRSMESIAAADFWTYSDGTSGSHTYNFVSNDEYNAKWSWLFAFLKEQAITDVAKAALQRAIDKAPDTSASTDGQQIRTEVQGFLLEQEFSKFGWIGTSANYADVAVQAAFLEAYKATLK